MDKVAQVRKLVERGIVLSPESARVLLDEIGRLKAAMEVETEQFNLGHDAAMQGKSIDDQPRFESDTDMWGVGWCWGMYLKEENEKRHAQMNPPSAAENL